MCTQGPQQSLIQQRQTGIGPGRSTKQMFPILSTLIRSKLACASRRQFFGDQTRVYAAVVVDGTTLEQGQLGIPISQASVVQR
ncbi:hypothetical protein BJ508DRAFT_417024 [Ascobolus immersus RN42]|uniref:Uncharacterized protein n=1 Tax=Ascobolus immersus RN42 TaxID=1160509 RepID=A0A3N4HYA8_ASCIM|nr:hypothetical protein BJ508DRAFT_417024 [Ascobolus immersus RN42]